MNGTYLLLAGILTMFAVIYISALALRKKR